LTVSYSAISLQYQSRLTALTGQSVPFREQTHAPREIRKPPHPRRAPPDTFCIHAHRAPAPLQHRLRHSPRLQDSRPRAVKVTQRLPQRILQAVRDGFVLTSVTLTARATTVLQPRRVTQPMLQRRRRSMRMNTECIWWCAARLRRVCGISRRRVSVRERDRLAGEAPVSLDCTGG